MGTDKTIVVTPQELVAVPLRAPVPRKNEAIAFGVAAVSDVLSIWTVPLPPLQLALDVATAIVLFVILGRRWGSLAGSDRRSNPRHGSLPRVGSGRGFDRRLRRHQETAQVVKLTHQIFSTQIQNVRDQTQNFVALIRRIQYAPPRLSDI